MSKPDSMNGGIQIVPGGSLPARLQRARRMLCRGLWLALLCLASSEVWGQQAPTEHEVKAAYLFNFGRFVRWPDPTDDSFSICILGQDPFGRILDATVAGEEIDGRRLSVRRILSTQEATGCEIVYVGTSEQHRLGSILSALASRPILTVSEIADFCDRNGMVQFVLEGRRVRFAVNRTAAERAGLVLSSDLLRVATLVKDSEPGR